MPKNVSDVLTLEETCIYLKIPRSTLYKLAQEGKVPCQKVGKQWRFHRRALESWISGTAVSKVRE